MTREEFYRDLLISASARFPAYPCGRYRGRGIVICAGGAVHLANAYVCMKFLRKVTNLPIEIFHAGDTEMPNASREYLTEDFAPIAIKDITAPEFKAVFPVNNFRGVHIKPHALLHSSFQEIFYIDADNIPLQSPEPLFESEEYLQTGAIFWPDLERTKGTAESLFRVFGVTSEILRQGLEFESGQIILDKRRCWKALLTTCLASSDPEGFRDFCFRHAIGDKDIFRLAFHYTETPYHLVPHDSLRIGNLFLFIPIPLTGLQIKIQHELGSFYATGMLQHDLAGDPLFIHKTVCEWDIYQDFHNLHLIEALDGTVSTLPLLTEWENQGYGYLKEFERRYQELFGRSRFNEFRGRMARWIMKILDAVRYLDVMSGNGR